MVSQDRLPVKKSALRAMRAVLGARVGRECGRTTWSCRQMRRPVFLWGAGRTGLYLLYDILSLYPEFVCVRARDGKNKGLYGFEHHGGGEYDYLIGNPFPPVEGVQRHVFNHFPEIRQTGVWNPDQLPTIKRCYRMLAASSLRGRRLLDKAPHYTFLIDLLDELFPDAQHIHCLRHPEAVAQSYIRVMGEPGALNDDGFWGMRPAGREQVVDLNLESRATWIAVHTIHRALRNERKLGDRCLQVRYEDVTENPRRTCERVCEFLDLPGENIRDMLPTQFSRYNKPLTDRDSIEPGVLKELADLVSKTSYPDLR